MKKIALLIFLITYTSAIGQIKKDTIYLYFKHTKNEIYGIGSKKDGKILSYIYKFNFNNKLNDFVLISVQTNDSLGFKREASQKWIDKKFLRKNKTKIYTLKRMQLLGFVKSLNELDSCVIYLIDSKIKVNNIYKAREVNIYFPENI